MPTRLETARLIIRTFGPGDSEPWLALVNDPQVTRFLPPSPPKTPETFDEVLERRLAQERDVGYSMWVVEDKHTGAFLGQCGIRPVDEGNGPEIDLAYHYVPPSWGKGYGTEAAAAVIAHGLHSLGLEEIMAVAISENVGSWRIMEKAGMRYAGLVDYYGFNGVKKYTAGSAWWQAPVSAA